MTLHHLLGQRSTRTATGARDDRGFGGIRGDDYAPSRRLAVRFSGSVPHRSKLAS